MYDFPGSSFPISTLYAALYTTTVFAKMCRQKTFNNFYHSVPSCIDTLFRSNIFNGITFHYSSSNFSSVAATRDRLLEREVYGCHLAKKNLNCSYPMAKHCQY